ncbi:MAG: CDP-diacylglycerol--glycerol-3-phosphate 3-phosphatidyltransferase [Pseudomonadota bacterium]
MSWTLPNVLTLFRLVAAPCVALVFLFVPRPFADWAALILFLFAALTDFADGYLARVWEQTSRFGAMLDPIADKAMVMIALFALVALNGLRLEILLPATIIVFREVFVAGLREFLGNDAKTLKVTFLAKWKTTAQMIAIAVLFAKGIVAHALIERSIGMDPALMEAIRLGQEPDLFGLNRLEWLLDATRSGGEALLWIAALLTLITGWDYFAKARPYLKEPT